MTHGTYPFVSWKSKIIENSANQSAKPDFNIALADYRRKKLKNNQPRTDNGNLKYLTYQEAAVVAKVSRSTIYDWINKKCFPVTYVMNIARIPRQEFELFLKNREEGGDINHGINSRKKR